MTVTDLLIYQGRVLDVDTFPYISQLNERILKASSLIRTNYKPNVLFLEWLDPPYIGGHWTPQLIAIAQGHHPLNPCTYNNTASYWRNIKGALKSSAVDPAVILQTTYDYVIISPCGLTLKSSLDELRRLYIDCDSSPWWKQLFSMNEAIKVYVVDGNEHFNRPGPRLIDALEFLVNIFHGYPVQSGFPGVLISLSDISTLQSSSNDVIYTQSNEKDTPSRITAYHDRARSEPDYSTDKKTNDREPKSSSDKSLVTLSQDIEDLHNQACLRHLNSYNDPLTGYRVLTRYFLQSRGNCCGNGCRHCPYAHFSVKDPNKRKNYITETVLFNYHETLFDYNDLSNQSANETNINDFHALFKNINRFTANKRKVQVLFWSGGKDSWLTYLHLLNENRHCLNNSSDKCNSVTQDCIGNGNENVLSKSDINYLSDRSSLEYIPIVLLTTFGLSTQSVSLQDIPISSIMKQATAMKVPVLLVPLCSNIGENEVFENDSRTIEYKDYKYTIDKALENLKESLCCDISRLVFGDLHLQDIRKWRVDTFSHHHVYTPLFQKSYKDLLNTLFQSKSEYNLNISISASDYFAVGTAYDEEFIKSIQTSSENVDIMGENGEFHTHVEFIDK